MVSTDRRPDPPGSPASPPQGSPPQGSASQGSAPSAIFTLEGARRGAILCVPLAIASIVFGLGYGILARDTGLSLTQAVGMSATVFAGASQMVAMEAWTSPPAVLGLAVAAFAINIRHVVMGAALRPWLRTLPLGQSHAALTLMTDANWALAMAERRKGEADGAIIVGGDRTSGRWGDRGSGNLRDRRDRPGVLRADLVVAVAGGAADASLDCRGGGGGVGPSGAARRLACCGRRSGRGGRGGLGP
jgi:hypothetical protein